MEQYFTSKVENCSRGCGKSYLPELQQAHNFRCFFGAQNCTICSQQVTIEQYESHLKTQCCGAFTDKVVSAKILPTQEPNLHAFGEQPLEFSTTNSLYTIIIDTSGIELELPQLLLAIHPSTSKQGWQVWLTFKLNSVSYDNSLLEKFSSKFKCEIGVGLLVSNVIFS